MRLVIVGDVHLADRPPSARRETYKDELLDKLRWIVDFSNREGVDALLFLGDVFHIKRPDRNSHRLVMETAEVLGASNAEVLITPGNHDLQYDDLSTIDAQPLGTLTLHPRINLLIGEHDSLPLFGLPYVDPTQENLEFWLSRYHAVGGRDVYPFVATHMSLFPEAQAPLFEYISYEDWVEESGTKWTAYGHIHSRVKGGPFVQVGQSWVVNNGAISRGSLHEETIHRELAITLFDSSQPGCPFTSIPLPHRPAEEVFRLEEVALLDERRAKVDGFLQSLGGAELTYLTTEGILEKARQTDLPHAAVKELEEIITNV